MYEIQGLNIEIHEDSESFTVPPSSHFGGDSEKSSTSFPQTLDQVSANGQITCVLLYFWSNILMIVCRLKSVPLRWQPW